MKVVAFNGSPRAAGNTAQAIDIIFAELQKEGIQTELVQLGGSRVMGCLACGKCAVNKDNLCVRRDDCMNDFIAKAMEADGIIIGSPTYFSNVSTEVKAFIDRCGYVNRANGGTILKGKVGASVVSVRRAGSNFVYAAINFFFGISEMIIPGSTYWNMTLSRDPGDILNDPEGMETFRNLGRNMARLMKKIR